MVILGIDSSIPQSSAAVLKDGQILSQAEAELSSTLPNQVLSLVDKVLMNSELKLADLNGFCLTIGPGSFTGLRIGTSLLKGLILSVPKAFIPISTLEANALRAMPTNNKICAILDAKKKQVYTAFFQPKERTIRRLTPDKAITPGQLCREINEPTIFVGNGVEPYYELLSSRLRENFLPVTQNISTTVAACAVLLAEKNFEANKCFDLSKLNIKYVRKPEAELKFMGK